MTAAVATVWHAIDAIHIQQQHGQHCIGLLHCVNDNGIIPTWWDAPVN